MSILSSVESGMCHNKLTKPLFKIVILLSLRYCRAVAVIHSPIIFNTLFEKSSYRHTNTDTHIHTHTHTHTHKPTTVNLQHMCTEA